MTGDLKIMDGLEQLRSCSTKLINKMANEQIQVLEFIAEFVVSGKSNMGMHKE